MDVIKVTPTISVQDQQFEFPIYKTVTTKDGASVEIVDRVERISVAQLTQQKQNLNDQLKVIQTKLDAITALG